MNGEINYDKLSDDELFAIGEAARRGRKTLHEVVLELKKRDYTFAKMGARWGVTESAASRWANPPRPWGRPAQRDVEDDETSS
jgi:hypothetical protein